MNDYDKLHQMVIELHEMGLVKNPVDRKKYALKKLIKILSKTALSLDKVASSAEKARRGVDAFAFFA